MAKAKKLKQVIFRMRPADLRRLDAEIKRARYPLSREEWLRDLIFRELDGTCCTRGHNGNGQVPAAVPSPVEGHK